jgi:hypothetical protein
MQLAWIEQEDKHFTQCHTRKVGYFHEIHKHSDRSAVFVDIHVSSSGHRHAFLVKVTSSSSKQPVQVPKSTRPTVWIFFFSFGHPHFNIYQLAACIHQNVTMENCLLVWALPSLLFIATMSKTDTSH